MKFFIEGERISIEEELPPVPQKKVRKLPLPPLRGPRYQTYS